ncbi:MAG TPA: glycosyltransferase family 4 protein [Ktedonobacterales bacterium]
MKILINYGRESPLRPIVPGEDIPMGGIRTAALALAAALARRGHEIHLFARGETPGLHEGVWFHERAEFAAFTREHDVDALVVIPETLPLLLPARARARVVWTGNAFQTGDCAIAAPWPWAKHIGPAGETARLYSMAALHPYADRIMVKSRWQAGYMRDTLGLPAEKFRVVYNGAPLEFFDGPAPARHPHRLVYTSQARRGLDVLARLFPQIRLAVPDAELHIFGYDGPEAIGSALKAALAQPGVYWRGSLGKKALAGELRAAGIMAYPCTLKETFCTAVAEAQAAGLAVVTSDRAALAERVEDGVDGALIRGRPGPEEPEYQRAFVEAVVRLAQDGESRARMGSAAAAKARRQYNWETIAQQWEEELLDLVNGREPQPPRLTPDLDLLDPSLLQVRDRGASAQAPAALAQEWLRAAWVSYGYAEREIPTFARGR